MPTTFNDEMLMAYVDAELDASTARLVEQAVKDNPDLAARVEAFRGSAAIAKQAFAAKLEEPVPDALLKSVNAAIEKERQRARDATPARSVAVQRETANGLLKTWFSWLLQPSFALAASVAAFTFTFAGYLVGTLGTQEQTAVASAGRGFVVTVNTQEQSELVQALNDLSSGQRRDLADGESPASVELVASFRDHVGGLCREFKLQRPAANELTGVACGSPGNWAVNFASTSPGSGSTYTPASSTAVLDAYLSSIEAGPVLSAEEERAALAEINK